VSVETGNPRDFAYTVSALRVFITVHDKAAQFRLSAVIAPAAGGARTVQATATDVKNNEQSSASGEPVNAGGVTSKAQTNTAASQAQQNAAQATAVNLTVPFAILEILENDAIPNAPVAPPPDDSALGMLSSAPPVNTFAPYSPPLTPP
jgi:hypothetical protein